jgi:hypothetical protein
VRDIREPLASFSIDRLFLLYLEVDWL